MSTHPVSLRQFRCVRNLWRTDRFIQDGPGGCQHRCGATQTCTAIEADTLVVPQPLHVTALGQLSDRRNWLELQPGTLHSIAPQASANKSNHPSYIHRPAVRSAAAIMGAASAALNFSGVVLLAHRYTDATSWLEGRPLTDVAASTQHTSIPSSPRLQAMPRR